MKVRPSVKPICEKCKIIKRKGRIMVICGAKPLIVTINKDQDRKDRLGGCANSVCEPCGFS